MPYFRFYFYLVVFMRNFLIHSVRPLGAALLVALVVSACGGSGSSAPPPPGGITVQAGDGQATVSWTATPDAKYWIFYAPATSIDSRNWLNVPNSKAILNTTTPYVVTELTNGTSYSFTLNTRIGEGPGGEGTPSITIVPRLAGATWASMGSNFGGNTIRSIGYGAGGSNDNGEILNYYVAVGDNGTAWRSSDGITWSSIPSPTSGKLNAISYLGKHITVGAGGFIAYGTDLSTWTQANSQTTSNLNAISNNGVIAIAVGDNGVIRRTGDGGTWTTIASPTTQHLYGVSYSSNGTWNAVGAQGTLLMSTDGGSTWKATASGTSNDLHAVVAQANTVTTTSTTTTSYTAVAVGDKGTVLRSTDGGTTWVSQNSGTTANLLTSSSTNQQIVAAGSEGTIIRSPDGLAWTVSTAPTTQTSSTLYAVLYGYLGKIVAAGQNGAGVYSQ